MLVVGRVGWGPSLHQSKLTPDEQCTHVSLWGMVSAPLLIGCDLERLDPLTLGSLTNDEVLAARPGRAGKQAVGAATLGAVDVYLKDLEDGGKALGLFNRGRQAEDVAFNKLPRLGLSGRHARAGPLAAEGPCGRRRRRPRRHSPARRRAPETHSRRALTWATNS